jgi:hypothetical protein
MNKTRPQLRCALLATVLLSFLFAGHKAAAVEALLLQDTYVDDADPWVNFGYSGDLRASRSGFIWRGGIGGLGYTTRAFLKFSIDTLPPGTTAADIKQARLRLWIGSSSSPCALCAQSETPSLGWIYLTPVTAPWSEWDLTANSSTDLTFGPEQSSAPLPWPGGNFVSIDITDWVQAWLAGTLVNEGFTIQTGDGSFFFDSKESEVTSHEPRLEIDLVGPAGPQGSPGPQGPQGPQGATGPAGANGTNGATGQTGPQGSPGPQGPQGATGATGAAGATGPAGTAGVNGGTTIPYTFSTNTTDSDPGFGFLRLNNSSQKNSTVLLASVLDSLGIGWGSVLDSFGGSSSVVKGQIRLQKVGDPATFLAFNLTARSGVGNYRNLTIVGVAQSTQSPFAEGDALLLTFTRTGDAGTAGATGPAGATGATGAVGPAGPVGPQGPQGVAGATGATGAQGPAGSNGADGAPGAAGPQGVAGANGNKWYSWTGTPEPTLGALNDYYLDVVTGDVWQKLSNEGGPEWTLQGNIRGPAGVAGVTGPQGDPGATGATGPAGPAGPAGATGETGPAGPQGPQGVAGAIGPQGNPGATGATGPAGPAGPVGATGETGPAGPTGPQGVAGATGLQGDPGATGQTGAQGPQGPTGFTGAQGPAGQNGLNGSDGPQGPAGLPGADGAEGPQGPPGPALTRVEPQGDLSMGEFTHEPTP